MGSLADIMFFHVKFKRKLMNLYAFHYRCILFRYRCIGITQISIPCEICFLRVSKRIFNAQFPNEFHA